MNLDTLRKKRIKRLGVKSPAHTGQKRVFFLLERATRKFHGDIGLWMQYINYARKQKAHKKLSQILTKVLRLHPLDAELWICAAQYALQDHGDMTQARSYMQQGLRFCKNSASLWLQYAKLEMIYVARIAARQKILGLDGSYEAPQIDNSIDDPDADMIALPKVTGEDVNPTLDDEESNKAALHILNSTPALSGAIPIAIFDAAMVQLGKDVKVAFEFYQMFLEFEETPCQKRVLSHVVNYMITDHAASTIAQNCYIQHPVAGISPSAARFPRAFLESLSRLKVYLQKAPSEVYQLADEITEWLQTLLATENLDPSLRQVLEATAKSTERKAAAYRSGNGEI